MTPARKAIQKSHAKLWGTVPQSFMPREPSPHKILGVHADDLVQEGNLGLLQAADRFAPTRGVRWAAYYIRRRMHELCRDSGLIHKPKRFTDLIRVAQNTRLCLRERLGRDPKPQEIVDEICEYETTRKVRSSDRLRELATVSLLRPRSVFCLGACDISTEGEVLVPESSWEIAGTSRFLR